jgi:hypothetical protein
MYLMNSLDMNSQSRSIHNTHSFFPDFASMCAWNCLITVAASFLQVMRHNHMYLMQSSTNKKK